MMLLFNNPVESAFTIAVLLTVIASCFPLNDRDDGGASKVSLSLLGSFVFCRIGDALIDYPAISFYVLADLVVLLVCLKISLVRKAIYPAIVGLLFSLMTVAHFVFYLSSISRASNYLYAFSLNVLFAASITFVNLWIAGLWMRERKVLIRRCHNRTIGYSWLGYRLPVLGLDQGPIE